MINNTEILEAPIQPETSACGFLPGNPGNPPTTIGDDNKWNSEDFRRWRLKFKNQFKKESK